MSTYFRASVKRVCIALRVIMSETQRETSE